VWSGGFEPFGRDWQEETAAGASENGVDLRLPGQWVDEAWQPPTSTRHYNLFRWFDHATGKFSRSDPLGTLAGVNQFLYASSNPVRHLDPAGLLECCTRPWDQCWASCIEARRLPFWQVIPFSALPKRVLPPFRVVNPTQPTTTVSSSAAHLLGGRSSAAGSALRNFGRRVSSVGTALTIFEGFFDLTVVIDCANDCSSDPCQNFLPITDLLTISPEDVSYLLGLEP
jgi:RHS repeat-associated protein